MNRFVIPVLVVVAAVAGTAAAAIAITDKPGAAPAGAPVARKPIATVAGSHPLTTLTLRSVRRTGAKVVTVQLEARLQRDATQLWFPELTVEEGDNGLRLLDETNIRRHAPLRDPAGECLCTGTPDSINAGERVVFSAKFPAPPDDVDEVSIQARGFPSFDRVPLTR